jgi:hypothetical protein
MAAATAFAAFGCARSSSPTSPEAPASPEASVLQLTDKIGWMCGTGRVDPCTNVGIAETSRSMPVSIPVNGVLGLTVVRRSFDYQEYFIPTLACGSALTPREFVHDHSREPVPQPSWFTERLAANWPAVEDLYLAFVARGEQCVVGFTFQLRSPPYSPYQAAVSLTVR